MKVNACERLQCALVQYGYDFDMLQAVVIPLNTVHTTHVAITFM